MNYVLHSKKLWQGKTFGDFGVSPQFTKFFVNFANEACRHTVGVVNVQVNQGT